MSKAMKAPLFGVPVAFIFGLLLFAAPAAFASTDAPLQSADEKKGEEGDEKEGPKDYWAGIDFGRIHFREVQEFIRLHYINPDYDRSMAYQGAANGVVSALHEDYELLPTKFYRKRRKMKEEKKRLAGKVLKFKHSDRYIMLHHEEDWLKSARRMNDDEIRAHRTWLKERYVALKEAWKDVGFGEEDFQKVVSYVRTTGKKKDEPVRENDIWVRATQGFLASLDPHSSLISEAAWDESTSEIRDGSFFGIGALLTQRQEDIIVESPLEGQPAAAAGLRAGDLIVQVNGADVRGLPLMKVVSKIRGPKDTEVVLTVQRVGVPENIDVKIIRSFIELKNVTPRLLGPEHAGIGHIKVRGFIGGTTEDLRANIAQLRKQTPTGELKGLILDLRNNSGGLLQEAVQMADLFLGKGIVVSVENRAAPDQVYQARKSRSDEAVPLVVLVNDGTASAAEIVANAVQENGRGIVLGDRTFGKATVQSLLPPVLGRSYFVKLTVARYFGPTGNTLQVHGVYPDVYIPREVGEKMPLGFREEDLYDHLPVLPARSDSVNLGKVESLSSCVKKSSKSEKMHTSNPSPIVKFDYQMYKTADWLMCVVRQREKLAKKGVE